MTAPLQLDCVDRIAMFRPTGSMPLAAAVTLIESAIGEARLRQCSGLMVQVNALSGFGSPSIAARHEMMRRWARAADARLKIAVVMPPHFIDPERFGEISAANFGLTGKGFLSETEALAWLRESP